MKPKTQKILDQVQNVYNQISRSFSDTRGKSWQGFGGFNKYTKDGDRVLDLGCGNGRMADIFNEQAIDYLGIDNSSELIKLAQARFTNQPNYKFEVGDALTFSYQEKFNLVLMIAVLHHVPTRELRLRVLKNIYNSLKPGGRLVISNWNLWQVIGGRKRWRYYAYIFNYADKLKRGVWQLSDAFVPWKPLAGDNLRYVHSFKRGELARLLKAAGFVIEKINFETKNGELSDIWHGDNLLAVAIKK